MPDQIIPYRRFRFWFEADRDIALPPYKGSAFRGLFGHALKRLVCPSGDTPCETCLLAGQCLYLTLFETPASGGMHRPGPNRDPHPFLLLPPLSREPALPAKQPFHCEIVLLGNPEKIIPHIALACQEMGRIGLGRQRARFRLTAVASNRAGGWTPLYRVAGNRLLPMPETPAASTAAPPPPAFPGEPLTLRTLTPLRIIQKGRLSSRFSFPLFLRALLFRLDDLARLYGNAPLPVNIPELLRRAETIRTTGENMVWIDFTRFSKRQGRRKLGGLEGEARFQGNLRPFWPWMQLGQFLHVGKSTSFGLGAYRLHPEPAQKSNPTPRPSMNPGDPDRTEQ